MANLTGFGWLCGDHMKKGTLEKEDSETTIKKSHGIQQIKTISSRENIALCQYIYRTWISPLTAKWQSKTWLVLMKSVHTNNDAKGWHNRLKFRDAHTNFYKLV